MSKDLKSDVRPSGTVKRVLVVIGAQLRKLLRRMLSALLRKLLQSNQPLAAGLRRLVALLKDDAEKGGVR